LIEISFLLFSLLTFDFPFVGNDDHDGLIQQMIYSSIRWLSIRLSTMNELQEKKIAHRKTFFLRMISKRKKD